MYSEVTKRSASAGDGREGGYLQSRLTLSARLLYDTTTPFERWSAVSSFQRAAASQDLVQVERLLVLSCYCRGHRTIFYAIRAAYASYS